ncbi:Uncharacterised protein [Vibrio cholerae]|nr:Uncharacterised protein [Vibrio cholerae]CSI33361.1 Uncharacterised protein [Vibrio cholerae]
MLISPERTIFANSMFLVTRFAAFRAFRSTTSPVTFASSDRRTSADTKLLREVKPNFGRRCFRGI